jgi:diguanylate cyclase (GGDEF)-like protein/PAS domain S-box-containing protein
MVTKITKQHRAEGKYRIKNQQYRDIVEFLPDPTFVVDRDQKVIAWNRAMEEMTGIRKEDILGKGDYVYAEPFYGYRRPILIDLIFPGAEEAGRQYQYVERKGNSLFVNSFVPSLYQGRGAFLRASASPVFDRKGRLAGAVEIIRDMTGRRRLEKQLQFLATHDPLVNIPNRFSLEENLDRSVAKAKRGQTSALLFIDLDNFKLINDALGHAAGDQLLIGVANVLKSNLREGDFIARMGGDEFAVLLEGTTVEEAGAIAEKLRQSVERDELCLVVPRSCVNISISVGIVMIDGTLGFQKILAGADSALYAAKEGGRNRVAFVEPGNEATFSFTETNQLIALIKGALKENRFTLFFQPVVEIDEGKIAHYETLLRLRDQDGGIVPPGRFIPIAERFGLMPRIDRWVVRESLSFLDRFPGFKVFVNLSGISLGDESLLELIEKSILESGVDPSRIGFEITETAAVKDLALAVHWIRRLKKLGCSFALDDFGIGFSSFSYLRILPVDYLKIDGSFVRDMDKEPVGHALVQAINTVAHTLGKKTVAEFVENERVLRKLHEMGVDCGQGYYLGKPEPVS